MSAGWSWFVVALVVLNLAGIGWLLWWTAKRRPGDPKPEDTSHYWDGDITEFNKPMPRWWINGFYIALAFGFGYLFWFGGWGTFESMSGWSSAKEHEFAKSAADARLAETFAPYANRPLPELAADPTALALGRSIFANTCATCHGSSGKGAVGYPDLTDDIWNWGGSPDTVLTTVLDGREGVMPPWGEVLEGMGGDVAVPAVVAYVRSLSHPVQGDWLASRGKRHYDGLCAACHGTEGKGNPAIGAPDLTDDVWLYGSSREALVESIANGRHGVMPSHRALLGETRSRLVAAYAWSLSRQDQEAPSGASR